MSFTTLQHDNNVNTTRFAWHDHGKNTLLIAERERDYNYYNYYNYNHSRPGTIRVIWYQKKHSPSHTYHGHQ